MLSILKRRIGGYYANWRSGEKAIEEHTLLGKRLRVLPGTIRSSPDQDDAWFTWLCASKNRLFDIGANVGFTALIANLRGMENMALIDPNPAALSKAAANLIYNNMAWNIQFVNSFISDKTGETIPFYTVGSGAAGSMYKGHAQTAASIDSVYHVPTMTVDQLVKQLGWVPDLIKIDVEGAEAKVLEGARTTSETNYPWFMVEMHSPPELPMVKNAELVLDWCSSTKYTAWYMKDAVKLKKPDLIANRGKCHLLLLPGDTAYPQELAAISQRSPLPGA
jgi:FkbM family methyltransferase